MSLLHYTSHGSIQSGIGGDLCTCFLSAAGIKSSQKFSILREGIAQDLLDSIPMFACRWESWSRWAHLAWLWRNLGQWSAAVRFQTPSI